MYTMLMLKNSNCGNLRTFVVNNGLILKTEQSPSQGKLTRELCQF